MGRMGSPKANIYLRISGGGGGTNPACCRYGYGFVQGANAAAAEKDVQVE